MTGLTLAGLSMGASAAELTIGSKAPQIEIEHWVQDRGGAFTPVKEFAPEKVYVIEFWATWCGPCVGSIPHLAQLQEDYADKGVTVISVSDEKLDTITKFLDEKVRGEGDKTYRDLTKIQSASVVPSRWCSNVDLPVPRAPNRKKERECCGLHRRGKSIDAAPDIDAVFGLETT
jgi:thiol-disulfide isomerase/thioredoxin